MDGIIWGVAGTLLAGAGALLIARPATYAAIETPLMAAITFIEFVAATIFATTSEVKSLILSAFSERVPAAIPFDEWNRIEKILGDSVAPVSHGSGTIMAIAMIGLLIHIFFMWIAAISVAQDAKKNEANGKRSDG